MATTARGIIYPVVGDNITPLANHFANLATSVNTALDNLDNATGYFIGTDAQRLLLASPKLREGITWQTNDTDLTWYYNGSAWVWDGLESATLTAPGGITYTSYRLHRQGRLVIFSMEGTKASDVTAGETVGTLPAGYRPVNNLVGGTFTSGGFGFINSYGVVESGGGIRANTPGASGVRNFYFSMAWFRD